MRAVVQRVLKATVEVEGEVVGSIGNGFMVLLGVGEGDTREDAVYIADKISFMRVFEDENGRMNLPLGEAGGEVLLVSQFTLYGDARHGRRPSFSSAARPALADELYMEVKARIEANGINVSTGIFQAHMNVSLVNSGPVTLLLDSSKHF